MGANRRTADLQSAC